MDFRLLRYFVAVAEELHLARAAERLGIEQSPVSRAMRDLKSQLGVQLFAPSTRAISRATLGFSAMQSLILCVMIRVRRAKVHRSGVFIG